MSDPVRTDRDRKSTEGSPGPSTSFLRRLAGQILDPGSAKVAPPTLPGGLQGPPGIRIDGAHGAPGGRAVKSADDVEQQVDLVPAVSIPFPASRSSRREEEVVRQTSQIADHLRSERQELERREHALHEQHALLDQEWRSARLWVHELEEEMLKRQADFKAREEDLNEKIGACETLISDLEEQENLVLGLRDQIAAERASLRGAVDRELEVERLALRQTRQALDEERRALAAEFERRRREHEESSRALNTRLDVERVALRSQLETQLKEERSAFDRERSAWNAQRALEEEQLSNRRDIAETASQRVQDELHSIRQREFDELRREREALESQLAAQREIIEHERQKLEADRQRFSDELAELKKIQVEEIEQERLRVQEELDTSRRELDTVRLQIEDDLKRRVDEREGSLREEQQRLEDRHREQLARLEQERNLLENRIRFQQDHLQKARQEVEAAQQELRRQHQTDRTDLERRESVLRLRNEQLARVRSLLEEREQSLSREHSLIAERRRSLDLDLAARSDSLAHDLALWERERNSRETELRQREEVLAADSDRLESRRQRLDGLRIELEDTHRNTLEMRMAIEEVWAQLSQQTGTDAAKRRLAEMQRLLEDDWQQIRETIAEERRELAELQSTMQVRRNELEREKQEAHQAADERNAEFDRQRKAIADDQAALRIRKDELAASREKWLSEKLEVEQIIRGLLVQLGQQAEESIAKAPETPR
jgi:hypothetical protein